MVQMFPEHYLFTESLTKVQRGSAMAGCEQIIGGRRYLGNPSPVIACGESQQLNSNTFSPPIPFPQVRVRTRRVRYPLIDFKLVTDEARFGQLLECSAQPS